VLAVVTALASLYANAQAEQPAGHAHDHEMPAAPHNHADTKTPAAAGKLDAVERSATAFAGTLDGLPDAVPTQTVELKDGDTFDITAAYVKKPVGNKLLRMLAYNGSIPGPFIKAAQDSEITVRFHNETDLEQTMKPTWNRPFTHMEYESIIGMTGYRVSRKTASSPAIASPTCCGSVMPGCSGITPIPVTITVRKWGFTATISLSRQRRGTGDQ
jgi:hypothetical protein